MKDDSMTFFGKQGGRVARIAAVVCLALTAARGVLRGDEGGAAATAPADRALRMGLADCVACTLRANPDIRIMRIEPRLREADVTIAATAFDPSLTVEAKKAETPSPVRPELRVTEAGVGVGGKLAPGTRYGVEFLTSLRENDPFLQGADDIHIVKPRVTLVQPLFRGAGIGANTAEIAVAANRRGIAGQSFRDMVMETVGRAVASYHNLRHARQTHALACLSLARAKDLLDVNKARYAKGLISSVDLLETESAVAHREKAVIAAESAARKAEDALKFAAGLAEDNEMWDARLELSDAPGVEQRATNLAASLENAFKLRPDYQIMKMDLKNRDIAVALAENALFPAIDLSASYGLNGFGTEFEDAARAIDGDNTEWTVGLQASVPWGGGDRAKRDQKKLEKAQALLRMKRMEMAIVMDVRDRVRDVETLFRQVQAAEASFSTETRNYEAQKERYAAGQTSTHDMLEYQNGLTAAEADYLKAVVDYQIAVVNLDRAEGATLLKNGVVVED